MKKQIVILLFLLINSCIINAAVQFATQPYLQNLTPTSVTVMWVTSGSEKLTGWVEYGTDSCSMKAYEYDHGLKQAFRKIYRVKLDGLRPGTRYQYRAVIREITGFVGNTSLTWGDTSQTDVYYFTTPEETAAHTQCVIFNDVHSNEQYVDSLMTLHGLSFNDMDFVFFNGDMLNAIPSENEILQHFLAPYSSLFASQIPFYSVRGNHEYRNKYARHWFDYVQTGDDNRGYYSFSKGNVFFIVLDTGEDKEDSHSEYNGLLDTEAYRASQVSWLEEQLTSDAGKQAAFTIVFMHIPFYSNTSIERYAVGDTRRLFLPLMNKYGVDVVISGHTHKAGIINADDTHSFPIVIGGGKDINEEKKPYCPTVITLKTTADSLFVNILDWYSENRGSLNISK